MPAYWVARSRVIDPVEYKKYTESAARRSSPNTAPRCWRAAGASRSWKARKIPSFRGDRISDFRAGRRLLRVARIPGGCRLPPQRAPARSRPSWSTPATRTAAPEVSGPRLNLKHASVSPWARAAEIILRCRQINNPHGMETLMSLKTSACAHGRSLRPHPSRWSPAPRRKSGEPIKIGFSMAMTGGLGGQRQVRPAGPEDLGGGRQRQRAACSDGRSS